jgi:hypothetical protein
VTRRLWLALLRIYPGAALIVLSGIAGYALGRAHGYSERLAEEAGFHNVWQVDE